MQISTRIANNTYYEIYSQRTRSENNTSVSFKMKYSETDSVNRTYEGRGKSAVDAYNELGTCNANGFRNEFEEKVEKQFAGRNGELTGLHKSEKYESNQKTAPYKHLADENGVINYKGVSFVCDAEKNRITLGDCSDPNKCLMVTLKDGGTLMANLDNLDDLAKAITMFDPEDQERIMRAITVHNMSKQAQDEIENDKNSLGDSADAKIADKAGCEDMSILPEENFINWEDASSCKYSADSTEKNPVVEVSTIINGELFTEKIHINDIDPANCTQQEIKAYLYHYDEINGTEGSYETLMAYAETAQRQGYWDGNDSYEEFANDTYSWRSMITDVWKGAARLGLSTKSTDENDPARKMCDAMERDHFKHINFDIKDAKLIDMRMNRDKVSLHIEDLLPVVPREIINFLHQNCFSDATAFIDAGDRMMFMNDRFNHILQRIGEQIKADGTLHDIDAAWRSALNVIDSMASEIGDYYGDKLGSNSDTKREIFGLKNLYNSIAEKIKNREELINNMQKRA